ncbi:MAG: HD domain-containing protein [Thermoleophilia bacterium]|nr:HD domain-containing protein [Thermoleophilia bacterium]
MKTMFQQLEENQSIDDIFICAGKTVREDKNGNKFLLLRLMNSSGTISAVKWRADEALAEAFNQGQIVKATGTVKMSNYRKALEIDIKDICPVAETDEIDLADLLPSSPRDLGEMESELAAIRAGITNTYLAVLLDEIFTDSMYRAYCQAPAAKGFHHNYIHGLLEHSVSVCRVAGAIADQYPEVNRDLLVTGAILHDIGKTVEFDYTTAIDYSDSGRLLGHIVLGEKMVADAIARLEAFPEELALQLQHMILSHHGEKEYGSPIRPKTPEAFLLNHADDIDAKANVFQKKRAESDEPWSEFNRPLDRFLYLRKVEE